VRREEDVVEPGQPRIEGRLLLEHVEARAAEMAGLQQVDQRRLVDQPAARAVDHDGAARQQRQGLAIEDVAGRDLERRVQADEVAERQHLLEVGIEYRAVLDLVGGAAPVVIDHAQAEAAAAMSKGAADPAEAARRADHQAEGKIGDAAGGDVRRIGEDQPARPRGGDIGMVEEARGRGGHLDAVGQRLDEPGVEPEGRGEEDRVGLVLHDQRHRLVRRKLAVLVGDIEHLPRPGRPGG